MFREADIHYTSRRLLSQAAAGRRPTTAAEALPELRMLGGCEEDTHVMACLAEGRRRIPDVWVQAEVIMDVSC